MQKKRQINFIFLQQPTRSIRHYSPLLFSPNISSDEIHKLVVWVGLAYSGT